MYGKVGQKGKIDMVTYSYRKLAMVEKFLDYDGIRSSVYISAYFN